MHNTGQKKSTANTTMRANCKEPGNKHVRGNTMRAICEARDNQDAWKLSELLLFANHGREKNTLRNVRDGVLFAACTDGSGSGANTGDEGKSGDSVTL